MNRYVFMYRKCVDVISLVSWGLRAEMSEHVSDPILTLLLNRFKLMDTPYVL
jgi:hypothetical protein